MTQIVEIKNNPFWEQDVDNAIENFEATFGVKPHMYIGRNFVDAVMSSYDWISNLKLIGNSNDEIAEYKGTPCEYDPVISCVILKA